MKMSQHTQSEGLHYVSLTLMRTYGATRGHSLHLPLFDIIACHTIKFYFILTLGLHFILQYVYLQSTYLRNYYYITWVKVRFRFRVST